MDAPNELNKFREIKHKYVNLAAIRTDGSKDQNKVDACFESGDKNHKIGINGKATVCTAKLTALIKQTAGQILWDNDTTNKLHNPHLGNGHRQ